ncbi:MAG: FAD-binding protein [Candidatus Eremiobacteraeota bacterium]|nr:FAD-binding protein [Candidatus Eremiobacteraeota bacterium]MBV8355882.1 FAD-binding protein [Candidatus Eremiobacteraeota bacterium]
MTALVERLIDAVDAESVLTEPEDLAAYAFDAYSEDRLPTAAVVPRDARDVCRIVKIAAECDTPIVARGAGTGLCGGAVPARGGVVVSFARMNRILELDARNRRARVQPGVVNLELSHAAAPLRMFYAPDPSSQKISTLGGNVATNAGGPHCLSYGTTVNHVLAVEYVDHRGEIVRVDQDEPGYDLTGVLVGSEGTLGIVTSIDVRLMRVPEAVRVCLAAFADVESASEAVSQIIGAGIVPIALEIMDRLIIGAVEAAFHAGYPQDAGAVLLVEIAGLADDMDASEAALEKIARSCGAMLWRSARSHAEREALWAARKGAAGAIGRIAPNYYIQDCTVPRTRLPEVLHRVDEIARRHRLAVGNVFHAGDGNLHPLLMFDRRVQREIQAVIDAGSEILATCIQLGGTISGEHGIGYEKRESLSLVFSADDLATMGRVRDVLDPARRFNPDKIFPSGAICGEVKAR